MNATSLLSTKRWTLAVVCAATAMLMLDIAVVNTALSRIAEDLDTGLSGLQWVVDAYTLALASVVLTAGSLADRFGRRRLFTIGLAVFTAASAACAASTDIVFLDAARAVQGIGAAIMFAVSLALLANAYPDMKERAGALAAYGATIGASFAIGPLVGGALTSGLDWQWIFLINIPIGIFCLWITRTKVQESRDPATPPVDVPGQIALTAGLFLLVLALLRGNDVGWGSTQIVAEFAGAAVALVAFLIIEARSTHPMLPLRLFRNPSFTGAQIAAFGISASFFAIFLYATLYLQQVLGLSAIEAGLVYLPGTILNFVVAGASSQVGEKVPHRIMISVGLALVAIGMVLFTLAGTGSSWTVVLPGELVALFGVGPVQPVGHRRRPRLGAAGAERPGRRRQRHVPPGRHRGRHRRPRRADPVGRRDRQRLAAGVRRRPAQRLPGRCRPGGGGGRGVVLPDPQEQRPPRGRGAARRGRAAGAGGLAAARSVERRSYPLSRGEDRRSAVRATGGSRPSARPGAAAGGSRPPASRRGAAASAPCARRPVSSTGSRPSSAANAKACATSLIGPAGTPASPQPRRPSRRPARVAKAASSSAASASRCSTRAALVAKRSSPASSRAPDDRAQPPEDRVVADGDGEVAVGGREGLVRGDGRVAVAQRPGTTPGVEVRRGLVEQAGQRRVHQRDLDVLAAAVALARVQRGLDAVGGEQAADQVDERGADLQRPPVGLAGDRHQPAHRLQQQVVAGQRGGPLARAEGADRAVHDAGVGARDLVVAEAEPVAGARAGRTRPRRRRGRPARAPAPGRPGP